MEKMLNLEVDEVILVQRYLEFSRLSISTKSEVLHTFTPSKSYAYLFNVEPNNLIFLKTYNTDFKNMLIIFMDRNVRLLEIEDKK